MHFTKREILFLAEAFAAVILIGVGDWVMDLFGWGIWAKCAVFAAIIGGVWLIDRKFVHSRFPRVIEDGAGTKKTDAAMFKRWLVSVLIFLVGMTIYVGLDRLSINHRVKMAMEIGLLVASYFPAYKMAPEHYHKVKKFLWTLSALLFASAVMIVAIAAAGAMFN